jgi:molybdopterin synthase catalytic subunit
MSVSIQEEDFDVASVLDEFRQGHGDSGAVVSFTGLVRTFGEAATIEAMTLEHYPGMTEKSLAAIEQQARSRWELNEVRIIHRIGRLAAGENIVLVVTASAHRQAAFEAAQFIMDHLKTEAPFWKKEHTSRGDRWVEGRQSDHDAKSRW